MLFPSRYEHFPPDCGILWGMDTIRKRSSRSRKELFITVITLAWPTMLEMLLQTAVQYIDTAMVGSLGTAATAAVGSTVTVNWLIGSTVSAVGIGFLSVISRAMGASDPERTRRVCAQAVSSVLMVGGIFTLITVSLSPFVPLWMQVDASIRPMAARYFMILYTPMLFRSASMILGTVLRAASDTKTPMKIGLRVNVINVVLNFLFIYPARTLSVFGMSFPMWGAGWGITGAAIASAASFVYGGIAMSLAVWKHPLISPRGYSLKPDKTILGPCFRIAFPNMLQRFGTSLGYVAFAAMINALGTVATAAHTVANTVESAFYVPGFGMQTAAATLTGNALGAGDEQLRKDMARIVFGLETAMMLLSGSLLFAFAPGMVSLFIKDPEVIALGSTVLRMVACSEPFYGLSIIIEGMLQGAGRTLVPSVLNIAGMWGIRIAGTFVFTGLLGMGLVSAWACMITHNMLLFIAYTVYYRKLRWA